MSYLLMIYMELINMTNYPLERRKKPINIFVFIKVNKMSSHLYCIDHQSSMPPQFPRIIICTKENQKIKMCKWTKLYQTEPMINVKLLSKD